MLQVSQSECGVPVDQRSVKVHQHQHHSIIAPPETRPLCALLERTVLTMPRPAHQLAQRVAINCTMSSGGVGACHDGRIEASS